MKTPFILDSGSTIHVCNDQSRLLNLGPNQDKHTRFFAGDNIIQISGWQKVKVEVNIIDNSTERVFTLIIVAYVPSIHKRIVGLQILIKAEISGDNSKGILSFNSEYYTEAPMWFGQ